jgi:hypothetical protein
MENLAERKLNFIHAVTGLTDERVFQALETTLKMINTPENALDRLSKPIRKKLDLATLKAEQNWKGHHPEKMKRLVKEMDFKEPIEHLLSMLTK